MTTAAENKDAFIAAYVASRPKTPRGTEHSPEAARKKAEYAWPRKMYEVVVGKSDEPPCDPCNEPEYSDVLRFSPRGWGSIQPRKEGIRVSKAVAAGRPQSNKEAREAERQFWIAVLVGGVSATEARGELAEWVVVELPTGPAVVTIEEAYSLGAREIPDFRVLESA